MAPKLYYIPASPPVRSVLMTADALGINLDLHKVDLLAKEHLNPEFIKINPQHTVPTLDDDGYILWESHAINPYLVGKYGKDDSLYPKDLKKRGRVNQRLHFNSSVLFHAMIQAGRPIVTGAKKEVDQAAIDKIHEAYAFLNAFLEGNEWVAGDQVTVADFCIVATASTIDILVPIDEQKYPNLAKWYAKIQKHPSFEAGRAGLQAMKEMIENALKK